MEIELMHHNGSVHLCKIRTIYVQTYGSNAGIEARTCEPVLPDDPRYEDCVAWLKGQGWYPYQSPAGGDDAGSGEAAPAEAHPGQDDEAELIVRVIELDACGMLSSGELDGQIVLLDDERDAVLKSFASDEELEAWLLPLRSEPAPDQAAPPAPTAPPGANAGNGSNGKPSHHAEAFARMQMLRSQCGLMPLSPAAEASMSDEEIAKWIALYERTLESRNGNGKG